MIEGKEVQQLHALISGHVQGVGFRYFVKQSVGSKNVVGWVRNLTDGRVEVLAEGLKEDLAFLLTKIGMGPQLSYVEKVERRWAEVSQEFSDFSLLPTARHPVQEIS